MIPDRTTKPKILLSSRSSRRIAVGLKVIINRPTRLSTFAPFLGARVSSRQCPSPSAGTELTGDESKQLQLSQKDERDKGARDVSQFISAAGTCYGRATPGDTSPQDGYGHAPSRWSEKGKRVTRWGPWRLRREFLYKKNELDWEKTTEK